jgi:hypothetical protein
MGNYFTANKITTHDNTISSECNIDIFVNKKSLDENIEIIETSKTIEAIPKTIEAIPNTTENEPIKGNNDVKNDNKLSIKLPETVQSSEPATIPETVQSPASLRPVESNPSKSTTPKVSPVSVQSIQPSPPLIRGGEVKLRSDSDISINEEVSSDDNPDTDNAITTQIPKHKKRNKRKKKSVSEIKPQTDL